MTDLYERLDELVDTDPIGLRDQAYQILNRAERAEQEVERLRAELANVQRGADTWKDAADGWEERAERLTIERDEQRQRAEQAEAAIARMRDLLPRSSVGRVYDYVLKADVLAALDASSAPESPPDVPTAPTRPCDTNQPHNGQETTP